MSHIWSEKVGLNVFELAEFSGLQANMWTGSINKEDDWSLYLPNLSKLIQVLQSLQIQLPGGKSFG